MYPWITQNAIRLANSFKSSEVRGIRDALEGELKCVRSRLVLTCASLFSSSILWLVVTHCQPGKLGRSLSSAMCLQDIMLAYFSQEKGSMFFKYEQETSQSRQASLSKNPNRVPSRERMRKTIIDFGVGQNPVRVRNRENPPDFSLVKKTRPYRMSVISAERLRDN